MVTLKYISFFLILIFLIFSCNKYEEDKKIYQLITIDNWKSKENVVARIYHYKKQTNFLKVISIDSLFEITNDSLGHYLTIIPEFENDMPINDDMILLLNDSIEYRFTNVSFIKDTVKRPTFIGYKFTIRYNLKATVNDKEINYADTLKSAHQSSYISLDATLGKRIK